MSSYENNKLLNLKELSVPRNGNNKLSDLRELSVPRNGNGETIVLKRAKCSSQWER